MGTEKFSKVVPATGHGRNIQPLYKAWGDPATGISRVESLTVANVEPAGLFSTAPYVEPPNKYRGAGTCEGRNNTCKARAIKDTRRCYFHTQGA